MAISVKKFIGRKIIIYYTKDDDLVQVEGTLINIYKNIQDTYSICYKNEYTRLSTITSNLIKNVKIEYYPIEFEKSLETHLYAKLNNDVIKAIAQFTHPFIDL